MNVPVCHPEGGVPQKVANRRERGAGLHQVRLERVPKGVDMNCGDLRRLKSLPEIDTDPLSGCRLTIGDRIYTPHRLTRFQGRRAMGGNSY